MSRDSRWIADCNVVSELNSLANFALEIDRVGDGIASQGSRCASPRNCAKSRRLACALLAISAVALAQDKAADFFQNNCAACHTIGGGAGAGPDLKDVTARRNREWLIRFIENPQKMMDSNDSDARKLVRESGGMVMPAVEGIDRGRAEALIDYLASASKPQPSSPLEASAEAPFNAADRETGKQIVRGSTHLENGGPACASCHNVNGLTPFGGGRLGPDLTDSYTKLGARKGMVAWLGLTPTTTMQAVYKAHPLTPSEITSLTAYLESVSNSTAPERELPAGTFTLIGIGGSLVGLVVMEGFWRRRFRAVRRPLVARRRSQ